MFVCELAQAQSLSPKEARTIARDAYIYGYPIVDSYRIQYSYFADMGNAEYKGGWNAVHSTARVYTPNDKAIQTPNSDTPYSTLGADLRAEPLVISVPALEKGRSYSHHLLDFSTLYGYSVVSRASGNGAGNYLLAENQLSDSIVTFRIDQKTGALTPTGETQAVPSPVCIQFLPLD